MADEFDLASEQEQRWLQQALDAQEKAPKPEPLSPVGYCQSPLCELEFDERHPSFDPKDPNFKNKIFCGPSCAREYEQEKFGK